MPYDAETGRIHAPVGLASVALCLGEGLTDTGTVCRATNKIKKYSLITPRYDKTAPGRPPEYYADKSHAVDVPPSKSALISEFKIAQKSPADYPWINEFAFRTAANVQYEQRRWGYFVPYVTDVQDIFALAYMPWVRFYPGDDAGETAANKSWCRLDQFDGYLHNAEPSPIMSNVTLEYGEKPAYTPVISNGKYLNSQILNPAGSDHPGGVVCVAAVLTDGTAPASTSNLHYGATYFTRKTASSEFKPGKSMVGGVVGAMTGGSETVPGEILQNVSVDSIITDLHEAMIVPWVCEGNVTNKGDGTLTVGQGAKFFGLKFAEEFDAHARANVRARRLTTMSNASGSNPVSISYTTLPNGTTLGVATFALYNFYTDYPMGAAHFTIKVNHTASSTPISVQAFSGAGTTPGHGTMTIDGTGKTGVTLTGSGPSWDMSNRRALVRLYFAMTNENDSVTGFTITFQNTDENHASTSGNFSIDVELKSTGGLASSEENASIPIITTT